MNFTGRLDLMWIKEAVDTVPGFVVAVWAVQDGYGNPGVTPTQGYDWSGIRDSSPAAVRTMAEMARAALPEFLDTLKAAA